MTDVMWVCDAEHECRDGSIKIFRLEQVCSFDESQNMKGWGFDSK